MNNNTLATYYHYAIIIILVVNNNYMKTNILRYSGNVKGLKDFLKEEINQTQCPECKGQGIVEVGNYDSIISKKCPHCE